MFRFLIAWLMLVLFAGNSLAETWILKGTLLTPEETIDGGTVVIENETIAAVGRDIATPPNGRVVLLSGIITPGFIDLHNHLTWNVFPRWRPPKRFSNRYEWQEVPEYDRLLKSPQGRMISDGLGCEADLYAEVKALAGGATSVVGSFGRANAADGNRCIDRLARNLDLRPGFPPYPTGPTKCGGDQSGFPLDAPGVVVNEVFPFEISPERFAFYKCELINGRLRAVLIHLAEGSLLDAAAKREFRMLKGQDLLTEGMIVIHGAALTSSDFQDMSKNKVGLIWSPRSNDELYGGTANIPAALQAGVTIAIAPDWSPTGSAGVLQELNYAASKYQFFKPDQLLAMATSVPAKLARIDDRLGRLANGLYADIVVFRQRGASPFEDVVTATPADIQLVMVGGQPMYGDFDVLEKLIGSQHLAKITVCGIEKGVNVSGLSKTWEEIQDRLSAALRRYGTSLSTIECN